MSDPIELTARTRSTRVARAIAVASTLLVAAGCLASFVAGPESTAVRVGAGVAGLLIVLVFAWAVFGRRRRPHRLLVDHEGVRVWDGRGKVIVRLAWTELSGVGLMTNERARAHEVSDANADPVPWVSRRIVAAPVWLELFPADAAAVARHPELRWAWDLGRLRAPGEEQRWVVPLGDGQGRHLPVGEAVQRWRPQLWRGHRAASLLSGGQDDAGGTPRERPGLS